MKKVSETISNGIKTIVSMSPITIDKVFINENQKVGTLTAQLRQKIETISWYPSKRVTSDLQDNLFEASDFGFEATPYTSNEERVSWILVPVNSTVETLAPVIAKANEGGANIYRILSNSPILDENQMYGIKIGQRTMEQYADSQVTRYPKDAEVNGVPVGLKLILDKAGNPQYRRTFFSKTFKEDIDLRGKNEVFMSAAIKAELEGAAAFKSQTL